ncbi:MAG: VOC family protein [Pseudomonadota bacterium]
MRVSTQKITPCLWFDSQAEEAAETYASIFKNARIGNISRYGTEGREIHGKDPGSVMTVEFEIEGQGFLALNGGSNFKFNEAVSFQVHCETQEEVDYYWSRLAERGEEGPCGWLKDRYGVSWQVVPTLLPPMLMDPDPAKSQRVMRALLQMGKLDIAELKRAYEGRKARETHGAA